MKNRALSIGAALVFALATGWLVGAQQPRQPIGPTQLSGITITPHLDFGGYPLAFVVKASFQRIESHPSGAVDATPTGSVEFDLRKTNGDVILDGETFDDREIADALMAICLREYRKVNPDALPVRRRTTRSSGLK